MAGGVRVVGRRITTRSAPGSSGAEVVVAGERLDLEARGLGERHQLVRPDEPEPVDADPADRRRSPGAPASNNVVRRTQRRRGS